MEEDACCQTQQTADGLPCEPPLETDPRKGILEGCTPEICKEFNPPAVGMEFESYDDAYNYYNCYACEAGFTVRVKNSWFKRNSREKYGAVLCCSSQGFKRAKDVNRLRKETRTGCPAMMRMRLVGSKRWRILEAILDHNHILGVKVHKSVKKKLNSESDPEAQPVKLYRALIIDTESDGTSSLDQRRTDTPSGLPYHLGLNKGDLQAMFNFLCRMQLTNPNFFYLMDLNSEGRLQNVFWADARSRSANVYFGDVFFLDSTCLSGKYEVPLVEFVGMNHHGQSVLLGCGLLAGETTQSYIWLLNAWLACTSGKAPQTIITDRCKALQSAISQVLPRSHHRFSLSHIVRKVPEKLGGLQNYDVVRKTFLKVVYEAQKPFEFETAWGFMIQRFGISDEWLRSLYEDRAWWAPVYMKDTFFMGMGSAQPGKTLTPFFDKCLHKQTQLKEFLDKYELALQRKQREEAAVDMESRNSSPELRTRSPFELQASKIYTRAVFLRFQAEVEEMYSCFNTMQVHTDGPTGIFLVKERVPVQEGNGREVRDFEVLYNGAAGEVRCICSCFNFCGYLCRHALCVLNFNGVEEIPSRYILSRWKKDYKRSFILDKGWGGCDAVERAQWVDMLSRSALQVVEEGAISLDHYKAALRALEESLERVHRVEGNFV